MRKLAPGIMAAVALFGCKSDEEVAATPPDEVVTSTKSPAEIANCLGRTVMTDLTTRMRDDGAIVVKQNADRGNAGATLTIIPQPSGSRVEIRQSTFAGLTDHRSCY